MIWDRPQCARLTACLAILGLQACEGTLDAGRDRAEPISVPDGPSVPGAVDMPDEPPVAEGSASFDASPAQGVSDAAAPSTGAPPLDAEPPATAPTSPGADAGPRPPIVDAGTGPDPADAALEPEPMGPLPFTRDNPVLLVNDLPYDNWCGEFALLAASTGRLNLAGIVVTTSGYWPDAELNLAGWQAMVDAAAASGMRNLPELVGSFAEPLVAPEGGDVDHTSPQVTLGAQYIVEAAQRLGTPELPLLLLSGSMLTEIASAYLLEPSIADRVVVVATMGLNTPDGVQMSGPNGDQDLWAGTVLAQRMPFVQISAYYEQGEIVPEARVAELPDNPFGDWMVSKRPDIGERFAVDQNSVLAVVVPEFVQRVERMAYAGLSDDGTPVLFPQEEGCCWFVSSGDTALVTTLLWELLADPLAFSVSP